MDTEMQTVETYQDGVLIETRTVEVEIPDMPTTVPVQVDPAALADAQAQIAAATTVAGLRKATLAALDLLTPTD